MQPVLTDLDGTLLDHETYSWEAARPALERLELSGIPWILVHSKTRAEVEAWRKQLGNRHPLVVENGAAAFVPRGYFQFQVPGATERENYEVLEWGKRYERIVSCLQEASRRSRCPVRGSHEMTAEEVSFTSNLLWNKPHWPNYGNTMSLSSFS